MRPTTRGRHVRQLRKEAEKRGLDPNVWFGNVEQIASERIGRETVTYVSNIYKYYIAYQLVAEEQRAADGRRRRSGRAPGSLTIPRRELLRDSRRSATPYRVSVGSSTPSTLNHHLGW